MAEKIGRRRFIKTSVGAGVGAVVAAHLPAGAAEKKSKPAKGAEKIFRGGTIITMDDRHRQVEAVAVAGGRIIAAGEAWGDDPRRTRIVVIGSRGAVSAEALGVLLNKVPSGRPTETYRPLQVTISRRGR